MESPNGDKMIIGVIDAVCIFGDSKDNKSRN